MTFEKKDVVVPYNPQHLERLQRGIDALRRKKRLDALTPEQRAAEAKSEKQLSAWEASVGIETERYVLLSEVCEAFGMNPKAVKGFCKRHGVPTRPAPRRFWIAIVPFFTAYAQDTNVRTDAASRKRAARLIGQQEIYTKLDDATRQFFGA